MKIPQLLSAAVAIFDHHYSKKKTVFSYICL